VKSLTSTGVGSLIRARASYGLVSGKLRPAPIFCALPPDIDSHHPERLCMVIHICELSNHYAMSKQTSNQADQRRDLTIYIPHLLSAHEITHPVTVLLKFCEDNYLDRMKTIFWEVVSIAASIEYDYWEHFTPKEMLAFQHRIDLALEAAFLLSQRYEQTKKHRRRGVVEVANLPKRLSDDQIDHPETVIADLFITYSLADVRAVMHEIVIQAVCSDDLGMTNLTRRDMVWFCEQIEMLIEALYLLNPPHNSTTIKA